MDGPSAQGFLSLTALQAEGCGGGFAAVLKPPAAAKAENHTTGPGPVGNAPLLPAASPPAGEICSTLTLVLT